MSPSALWSSSSRALCLCLSLSAGCVSWSHPVPVGRALRTAVGPPQSPCESARWLDAVPSVMAPHGGRVPRAPNDRARVAVYPRATPEASLSAEQALAVIDEPAMLSPRLRRAQAFAARVMRANTLVSSGLMISLGGLLAMPLLRDPDTNAVNPLSLVGALAATALGVGLEVTGYVMNPSSAEFARAEAEQHTFADDEVEAVRRGVERHNAQVRAQCADEAARGGDTTAR